MKHYKCIVTFDPFNMTFLNKSIDLKKQSTDPKLFNGSVHTACSRNCEYSLCVVKIRSNNSSVRESGVVEMQVSAYVDF